MENLKAALLALPAAGDAGFEGLIAVTLAEISGVPFRLAGSGRQFGIDGRAAYGSDGICFEGKRYDGAIPRSEVISKIAEISITDNGETDLWVLGATSPLTAQLVGDLRKLGGQSGIGALILDWSENAIPPLAAALALSESNAAAFLKQHVADRKAAFAAIAALRAVRNEKGFSDHAERIRAALREPALGVAVAGPANARWLGGVFSDKQQARRLLGQPLSPGDGSGTTPLKRDRLVERLSPLLSGNPDGKIAAVLGEEGNGKSWLAAQSWLGLDKKPLMLVCTPDDFAAASAADIEDIFIGKLLRQTGGNDSEGARNRWRRKLAQWRNDPAADTPRLVVFFDGLNQRPLIDWGRLMDAAAFELERIGGRLIVSVRSAYFSNRIKPRLLSPVVEIPVPEWTDGERDEILAAHNIRGDALRAPVAASLKNPRLLGIAVDLLKSAQIEDFEELTVSRLLFEHLRVQERDAGSPRPANEFARKLRDDAREVLTRIASQRRDDLRVFDSDLEAASEGRFYEPIAGDPTRCALSEDGLTLALGFAVLDELRTALRNGIELEARLAAIVEPISALDRTASVLFAALTVACLDGTCPDEISAALVFAFAELQNPNTDDFSAFAGLARKRPAPFMIAARRLCLAGAAQPNFDWIEAALLGAKGDAGAWAAISAALPSWLANYSLSAERSMMTRADRDPADKVAEERAKKQEKLDERIAALSPAEREFLSTLVRLDDGDLSALARLALALMAGKPIAPFATAFAQWSFASTLNPEHGSPVREFWHLVRLNRIDWAATRDTILSASRTFDGAEISPTGKWTLANLLRATGHPDDAGRAERLIDELTADRPRFGGSRLVEKYCSSDPCDPNSVRPENIETTAARYAEIDASKIRLHMGNSEVDHFFAMARAGVARFEANIAIGKHREFASDVVGRSGVPLRQGLLELRRHNALLTRDTAIALVENRQRVMAGTQDDSLRDQDLWIVSQYRLLLAFPLLSAQEQTEALLAPGTGNDLLLELMDVAKPMDEVTVERVFDQALRDKDNAALFRILAFGVNSDTAIPERVRGRLADLAGSESALLRTQALRLIARIGDDRLIQSVADSGWTADALDKEDGYEAWYGSMVLLEAAARGLISHDIALDRMSPRLFGRAALRLGGEAARAVARRIDASIRTAAHIVTEPPIPDIELPTRGDGTEPTRYLPSERPGRSDDPLAAFKRLAESEDAFNERQKRIGEAFEAFRKKLTDAKARIVLDNLRIEEFDAIAGADKEMAESWYSLLVGFRDRRLSAVHNIGLLVAHALAAWSPEKAAHLFEALARNEPFVRVTFGRGGLSLDALSIWSAADSERLNTLRLKRLDNAANDLALAHEVLAAHWAGKQPMLTTYVDKKLGSEEPASIARALMVTGMSEHNSGNDAVLARFADVRGFIGKAWAAAHYAYERNTWAEHWFRHMCGAERAEDFWRYATLFIKIADERFHVWRRGEGECRDPFSLFWPSVESQLAGRFKKWQSERGKKLFGDDAPAKVFLEDWHAS